MSAANRPRPVNARCILINDADNETLFRLLGNKCIALASGVVQLFLSDADQTRWTKRYCGVACFVKDNDMKSYFVRLYNIKEQQLLWEQELYTTFKYKTPREFFHTFETTTCQAGLNFASEHEAETFKSNVEMKLTERHRRRVEKTQKRRLAAAGGSRQPRSPGLPPTPTRSPGSPPAAVPVTVTVNTEDKYKKNTTSKPKDKKGRLTKADISTPTNFVHVSHVGWDPQKGLDMDKLEPEMKTLFESVGIDSADQADKETVDFIYDFVGRNGGIDALREEIQRRPPPPPPPASAAPRPPPKAPMQLPSPPPSVRPPAPGPAIRQHGPPTPPRIATRGHPPPPPPHIQGQRGPPPRAPGFRPRAPGMSVPPPPPPGGAPPPPPPPKTPAPFSSGGGPPAPPPPPPPPPMDGTDSSSAPPLSGGSSNGRGALLQALQNGPGHLRKVDPPVEKPAVQQQDGGGLFGALQHALTERQRFIQGSDEEDDDDDDTGDSWDDDD